jgi:hypothetical protein
VPFEYYYRSACIGGKDNLATAENLQYRADFTNSKRKAFTAQTAFAGSTFHLANKLTDPP